MRIIKKIEDADFAIMVMPDDPLAADAIGGVVDDVDGGDVIVNFVVQHGTVLYVAGMYEHDDDALICLGAPEGSDAYRIAFWEAGFQEFSKKWYEMLGKPHLIYGTKEYAEAQEKCFGGAKDEPV